MSLRNEANEAIDRSEEAAWWSEEGCKWGSSSARQVIEGQRACVHTRCSSGGIRRKRKSSGSITSANAIAPHTPSFSLLYIHPLFFAMRQGFAFFPEARSSVALNGPLALIARCCVCSDLRRMAKCSIFLGCCIFFSRFRDCEKLWVDEKQIKLLFSEISVLCIQRIFFLDCVKM